MNPNLLKKVIETSYLTAQNVAQYRFILRFFYEEYQKLNYLLTPEEILSAIRQVAQFSSYTAEQLQQDLNTLVSWQNLIARQDVSRVTSIEQFKQKRFRYQCTRYTIEIERMLENLERITGYGGSLEATYFDKLITNLMRLATDWEHKPDDQVADWWRDLIDSFTKLTDNATDYLAHLQNPKTENLMMSEAFLTFKDAVRDYLRKFMQALQQSMYQITGFLQTVEEARINNLLKRVCDYEMTIPRLDEKPDYDKLYEQTKGQWLSLCKWFLGDGERKSELEFVQQVTNDTIRRITRYAVRLSENVEGVRNRKQDHLTLARMFHKCSDLEQAQILSACVFGVAHTRHLFGEGEKSTDRVELSVWEESPFELVTAPRVRNYRMRTRSGAMIDNSAEKQRLIEQYLQDRKNQKEMVKRFIPQTSFAIADLPEVDTFIRKTLLRWIDRAANSRNWRGKTEDGREYQIKVPAGGEYVVLRCTDGELRMPNYHFTFKESKE